MNKSIIYTVSFIILCYMFACTGKNISGNYYIKNKGALDSIEQSYKKLYAESPFTIAFTDKKFNTVAVEIITDSLSYIYEFNPVEPRLVDTLLKYKLPAKKILPLINSMQRIHCTWVNNFDYYVNDKQKHLIFVSIKPLTFHYPFMPTKYYMLAFFFEPQSFDDKGRLLDRKGRKRLRKINDAVFRKINSRVGYTIGEKFR